MGAILGAFVIGLLFHLVRVMSEAAEEVFYKKMFLKMSQYSGLQACNFIKKGVLLTHFPVDIAKFLRTSILKNIRELFFYNANLAMHSISFSFSSCKFEEFQKKLLIWSHLPNKFLEKIFNFCKLKFFPLIWYR